MNKLENCTSTRIQIVEITPFLNGSFSSGTASITRVLLRLFASAIPTQMHYAIINQRGYASRLLAALVVLFSLLPFSVASAQQAPLLYLGTATTTVQLTDQFGSPLGVETYAMDVQASVAAPAPNEVNPFQLVMESLPRFALPEPGEFSFASSIEDFALRTLQAWSYQMLDAQNFSGTLIENFEEQGFGLLFNNVKLTDPITAVARPSAMIESSTIIGSVTDQELRFRIEGNTSDQLHPFVIEGVLPRRAGSL